MHPIYARCTGHQDPAEFTGPQQDSLPVCPGPFASVGSLAFRRIHAHRFKDNLCDDIEGAICMYTRRYGSKIPLALTRKVLTP